MNKNIKRNNYRIDKERKIATFDVYDKNGLKHDEFIIDADDLDVVCQYRWFKNSHSHKKVCHTINAFIDGKNVDIMRVIARKYVNNDGSKVHTLIRVNANKFDFRKTNILAPGSKGDAYLNRFSTNVKRKSLLARKMNADYVHVTVGSSRGSVQYSAQIATDKRFSPTVSVSKMFTDSKVNNARECAIYAAYLFEKEYCGDGIPIEEYCAKELAFAVLTDGERAKVEDAIVDQLGTLKVARKKALAYLNTQTLAAKLASGEVIVRPDWKISDVETVEGSTVEPEQEPEPEPEPEPDAEDCTIKCSRALLTNIRQNKDASSFVHVTKTIVDKNRWTALGGVPNNRNIFNIAFAETKHDDAKAMAVYAAYLFEKLVYGDNFPKAEYNRKLEVIKTLSAKDIEFVNSKVAGKLEKVYTVLKELASEKSAKSDEPLSTYKIEKSTDELLKQIKQAPLKEDALETAATVDEPTEKYPDIFGNPEVQKAIAEMKQKPSLFQRIKNWFAN
jgi:hypothetical protein